MNCTVCAKQLATSERRKGSRAGWFFCDSCARSYDQARAKDVTVYAAIKWATERARLAEREACAAICDKWAAYGDGGSDKNFDYGPGGRACAAEIRERAS
jgi:hypothetical protein